jgi:hypothetical protein
MPIQKSIANLCRCRFRNRQQITVPIQKSATKNFADIDLEIDSQ